MKIISYNISLSNPQKIKQLLDYNADVYVIPEIAGEEEQFLPPDFEMKWKGINFEKPFMGTKSKGLGIIWRRGYGKVPDWYDESLTYAIPLIYDGVLILGFWPTQNDKCKSYTKIARQIIDKYSPYIAAAEKCIITGDFNLYHKPNAPNKAADIIEIDSLLHNYKFKSIYHELRGEAFGYETKKTFYMQFKEDNPFFLDYTYSNLPVKDYDFIKSPIEKFSDHIGQVIEL